MKVRILIVGSVNGKIRDVFKTVQKIQDKKGKFDLLFCCGQFLSEDCIKEFYDSVEDGSGIETYFVDASKVIGPFMNKKDEHKFSKNVFFMGRAGVKEFATHGGLRVAYLSGVDCTQQVGPHVSNQIQPYDDYMSNFYTL